MLGLVSGGLIGVAIEDPLGVSVLSLNETHSLHHIQGKTSENGGRLNLLAKQQTTLRECE